MTQLERRAADYLRKAQQAVSEARAACALAGCDGQVVFEGCSDAVRNLDAALAAVEARS